MWYYDLEVLEKFVNQNAVKSSIKAFALSILIATDNQDKESRYILSPSKNRKTRRENIG